MLPRPTQRWRRHAEVYRFMAQEVCPKATLDYSEQAAREAFDAESNGAKHELYLNGYSVGKHWANVHAAEWRQGIADGTFARERLLEDEELAPIRWWVEEVLA